MFCGSQVFADSTVYGGGGSTTTTTETIDRNVVVEGTVTSNGFVGNADSCSALAADPADCSAGQLQTGINEAGVAQCTATPTISGLLTAQSGIDSPANATDGQVIQICEDTSFNTGGNNQCVIIDIRQQDLPAYLSTAGTPGVYALEWENLEPSFAWNFQAPADGTYYLWYSGNESLDIRDVYCRTVLATSTAVIKFGHMAIDGDPASEVTWLDSGTTIACDTDATTKNYAIGTDDVDIPESKWLMINIDETNSPTQLPITVKGVWRRAD